MVVGVVVVFLCSFGAGNLCWSKFFEKRENPEFDPFGVDQEFTLELARAINLARSM
jgi:hypothetical protein